jgi:antitoxin (DNA-binding transcriptional repressor) of toxin-antitoxin stability system
MFIYANGTNLRHWHTPNKRQPLKPRSQPSLQRQATACAAPGAGCARPQLLKSYRVTAVSGDRFAGGFAAEAFKQHGLRYSPNAKPKSDLYLDLLPLLNSGGIVLPKHGRLLAQLVALERRTARSGKDSIDHGPGAHDDVANAVAGAALLARKPGFTLVRTV